MVKRITINLNKNDDEKLSFLYKHFQIPNEKESKRFRKLLAYVVEGIRHGSQDVKSSRAKEEVRLLEGWDCPCRFPFSYYHKQSKQWLQKIRCSNPRVQEFLGTKILEPEVCKQCYDTGGSANLPALPEPKKQVSKPTPKPEQVKRFCIDCKIVDISKHPSHHTRCHSCYYIKQRGIKTPDDPDYGKPLKGSPKWLRKREAARLRKLDARLKAAEHQTKEEIMKSAIEHGAELDMQFAEHDHRMKQQSKEE